MPISFAGGQYFYVTNDALFNTVTTAITYMCWVNLVRLPTSADSNAFAFFGRTSNTVGSYIWECGVLTNGNPVSEITTNSGMIDSTSAIVMAINTWYHYATTWDSTSQQTLIYINGALSSTTSVPGTRLLTSTSSAQMDVGANLGLAGANPSQELVGSIDDVRMYNRKLSAAEISTIYATHGKDDIVDNLFFKYPMNEQYNTASVVVGNIKDHSSNKIAFTTLVGSPTYGIGHNSFVNKPFRTN